jgi:hypothetical protein
MQIAQEGNCKNYSFVTLSLVLFYKNFITKGDMYFILVIIHYDAMIYLILPYKKVCIPEIKIHWLSAAEEFSNMFI